MVSDPKRANELISSCDMELEVNDRQLCDLECIMEGAFSPLEGFMTEQEYTSVVLDKIFPGTVPVIFGLPVVFDTSDDNMVPGKSVLLKHRRVPIAVFQVTSRFIPDKCKEAQCCYGSTSIEHPAVWMITAERGSAYCGGPVFGLNRPVRDIPCRSPAEVRSSLAAIAPDPSCPLAVVAFQCRNPIHRAHWELIARALEDTERVGSNALVLVHPTVGPTQHDDVPGRVRYETYEALRSELAHPRVQWDYLPYSMHMGGPREALQHMIIRKNYGCTHFILGRDMAGCKSALTGEDFYGPADSQELAAQHAEALGIQPLPTANIVSTENGFMLASEAKEKGLSVQKLSGSKFRKMLRAGEDIPEWFAFESVVRILRSHNDSELNNN
jgi:sulfate adenylyltransferase